MPRINTDDLVDAVEVARILGLGHRTAVNTYLLRYPDMPRPVIDLGPRRPRLWLRQDIERWARTRERRG
jgi:glutathione-regulated potassium-efflux system ancillary protein KefG